MIIEKKKNTVFQKLCEGLPFEFEQYLNYVRSLRFEEDPNYNYMKTLFRGVSLRNHFENTFEWRSAKNISDKNIEEKECQLMNLDDNTSSSKKSHFKYQRSKIFAHSFYQPVKNSFVILIKNVY